MMARKKMIVVSTVAVLGLMMGFQNCGRMSSVQTIEESSNMTDAAGGGSKFAGKGSTSVPTADGVVARITNGLQNNVNPTAGNFARSLAAVRGNLPRNSDPSKATGFDQVQLLVYAACTDLVTGGANSKMTTQYAVPTTGTIATNKDKLIAAGLKMFDSHTAGLASQPGTVDQVKATFGTLVDTVGATAANTTTIGFVSVCIAANTAGTTLLGF